jgi:hypothetical protein
MIGESALRKKTLYFLLVVAVSALTWCSEVSARKLPHIQTSALAYSASDNSAAKWFATHYDMLISGPQAFVDSMQRYDSAMIHLNYILYSSLQIGNGINQTIPSVDSLMLVSFCTLKGYNPNDFVIHCGPTDTVIIQSGWPGPAIVDTTLPNRWVKFYDWNGKRYAPDMRNPHMGEWWWYRYTRFKANDPTIDGVMEDEAACISNSQYGGPILSSQLFPWGRERNWYNPATGTFVLLPIWLKGTPKSVGWGTAYNGLTDAIIGSISDSIVRAKWSWIGAVSDSFSTHGQYFFRNPAAYYDNYNPGAGRTYQPNDFEGDQFKGSKRVNHLLGEGCYLTPSINTSRNLQYLGYVQQIVDSGAQCVLWVMIYKQDTINLASLSRAQMERLSYYYMAADPNLTWFCLTGNEPTPAGLSLPNDFQIRDTLIRWWPALQYNIGLPLADYFSAATGTDPAGQSYTIYRRDYANASVLWRPSSGSTWGSTSTATYNLGESFRPLNANGTMGAAVTSVGIRNCEGMILVRTGAAPTDTIPPATINDLGVLPGTSHGRAVFGWTAPGDDGQTGTAYRYEIRYSTSPITSGNWYSATVATAPTPTAAGTHQSLTVTGLNPGGQYYFAIKSYDDAANVSFSTSSTAGFAAGVLTPSPILTQVDSGNGSVTVTVTTVPSYMTLSYQFAIDSVLQYSHQTTKTAGNLGAATEASVDFNNLTDAVDYYWRCRAVSTSPADSSNWSGSIRFNLSTDVLRALVDSELVVPQTDQIFLNQRPIFVVAAVSDIQTVYFEVDDKSDFTSPVQSGSIVVTPDSATHWQVSQTLGSGKTWYARASSDNVVWTSPVPFYVTGNIVESLPETHAYPNPFRPVDGSLTFANVPKDCHLYILTMSGEIVRRMATQTSTDLSWDGRNESGNEVASGVYLWRLDPGVQKGKIIVIR